jgi:hypothetical protein
MRSPKDARRAKAGNAVAWLALTTSIVGLLFSFLQWRGTQDQLDLQRRAIDDQRGRLLIDGAYVDLYDAATGSWRYGANNQALVNQRLAYDDFERSEVFVVLDIYNVSHTSLTMKRAGVVVDGTNEIAPTPTFCPQAGPTAALTECPLPITLQPQTNSLLYLRLSDVTDALGCNAFLSEKGLIGAVQIADDRVASGKTQTFDPFSPVCAGPVTSAARSSPSGARTAPPSLDSTTPSLETAAPTR